jgi:hypothetical protein
MIDTQEKGKKICLIPNDKILKYNKKEFRPIANRQIESLEKRSRLTGNYSVYTYYINKVILHERGKV